MAVNTQKLLPASKPTTAERMASSYDKRVDTVLNFKVKTTLIDVDKLLKKKLKEDKKVVKNKKSAKKKEKRQKTEEKLEAPKGLGIASGALSKARSLIPRTGLLDAIQRFATFTFLGYLFTKFQQVSNLFNIQKENEKGEKTTENIFVTILNSLEGFVGSTLSGTVNSIQGAYDAYDKVRAEIEKNAGPEAVKNFDKFSDALKGVVAATVVLGGAWLKFGGRDRGYKKGFRDGLAAGRRGPKPPRGTQPPRSIGPTGQARAGGSFESNLSRQQLTRERMLPSGRRGPLGRIGMGFRSVGAQLETGTLFKGGKGLQKFVFKILKTRAGLKAVGRFFGPILKRIPIIGGLIDFALNYFIFREPLGRSAFKAIGATVLGAIGTGFGGPLGAIIGSFAGDWAGGKLYDIFFAKNAAPSVEIEEPIEGHSAGGQVSGGQVLARSQVTSDSVVPGKDVGGVFRIEDLYPNPDDPKKPNALKTLVAVTENFDRGGWVSKLMGAGIKVALGHIVNANKIAKSISGGVENLMNTQFNAIKIISNSMLALENGGMIPSIADNNMQLLNTISNVIESKMRESMRIVSSELSKEGDERSPDENDRKQEEAKMQHQQKIAIRIPSIGSGDLEKHIFEFRKERFDKYKVSKNRIASDQTGFLYIRDLRAAGFSGTNDTTINPLADDLSYQHEHEGKAHKEGYGFDIPVNGPEQGKFVVDFWKSRGYYTEYGTKGHYNHVHVQKQQGGGLVGKKKNYSSLSRYASYNQNESTVLIQPIIVTKTVPMPMPTGSSGGVIAFPVPVGVNNTVASLSRA